MRRVRSDLLFKNFLLYPIVALFAFGCASQRPAAPARPEAGSSNEYLVYVLKMKQTFLSHWSISPNFVAPDGTLNAKAKVLINRDGKVMSAKIIDTSGYPQFDESVQQALDQVKFVQPFGPGAMDEQRAFVINFELKPKSP